MHTKIDISMHAHKDIIKSIPLPLRKYFPGPDGCKAPTHQKMVKKMMLTFLLWSINKEPITGYSLIKKMEKEHPGAMANASRMYPLLVHMEEEGLLKSKILKTGKRESKEYSVTPKGKLLLSITNKLLSKTTWGEFMRDISRK